MIARLLCRLKCALFGHRWELPPGRCLVCWEPIPRRRAREGKGTCSWLCEENLDLYFRRLPKRDLARATGKEQ